jgi:tripartite-type tricarboxylate transporter receptor subunit TctC
VLSNASISKSPAPTLVSKEDIGMNSLSAIPSFMFLLALLASSPIFPQAYPSKPIRIIAPYPAGGPADVRARWLAEKLGPVLGQPMIVDNRAGAAGTIGTAVAAQSAPDGYTLVIVQQGTLAIAPHMYPNAGYDPIRDLSPVARLDVAPMMLVVHPKVPVKSVSDLLQLARSNPGELNFGSAGTGSPPHMAGELFRAMANIDVVHVPYMGASPALMDLIGGRLTYSIDNMAILLPHARAGRIRALAVTGKQRLASLPDTPTVSESGLTGYEYVTWMGISAPAGTSVEIIRLLNSEIGKILRTPEAREWFAGQGAEPVIATPAEFAAFINTEYARWGAIVKKTGIKPD